MTKDQIKDEIIRKYEELVKSFGNCNCDICEKANSELASLKSRLAEAGEEKIWDDVEKEWKEMQRPLDEPINL